MQSHFGGLALDVPQQRCVWNEKKATEGENDDTNISGAKRPRAKDLWGWWVPGGIVIPGSRFRWLQWGGKLLPARKGEKQKRKKIKERKRVQHPYCGELQWCCTTCLFLQFFNWGGTSSHFSIYISLEQHQLYFNINVTHLLEISKFSSH